MKKKHKSKRPCQIVAESHIVPDTFTTKEVAQLINRSSKTILRWVRDPADSFPSPVCKDKKQWAWDIDDIYAWLDISKQ